MNDVGLDGVDFEAPSSRLARQALETGDTKEKLFKFGVIVTGSDPDAEDLLADAFYVVCSPRTGRPWDPTRGSFSVHMRIVMKDMARRGRRSSRVRREVIEDGLAIDERTADPRDRADDALHEARALDRERRMGIVLRERISRSARTLQVFDLLALCARQHRRPRLVQCDLRLLVHGPRRDLRPKHASLLRHVTLKRRSVRC